MHLRTPLIAASIAAALALTGCNRNTDDTVADTTPEPIATTPAPAPVTEPAPLPSTDPGAAPAAPLTIQRVALGTAAQADNRIATPVTTFKATDNVVIAVDTFGVANNTPLIGKLVYQDGQTAGEQTTTLNASGAQSTAITFSNANGWVPGTYKAEVWLNGQLANTTSFTVQ